jgi:hypothetical protein
MQGRNAILDGGIEQSMRRAFKDTKVSDADNNRTPPPPFPLLPCVGFKGPGPVEFRCPLLQKMHNLLNDKY